MTGDSEGRAVTREVIAVDSGELLLLLIDFLLTDDKVQKCSQHVFFALKRWGGQWGKIWRGGVLIVQVLSIIG